MTQKSLAVLCTTTGKPSNVPYAKMITGSDGNFCSKKCHEAYLKKEAEVRERGKYFHVAS